MKKPGNSIHHSPSARDRLPSARKSRLTAFCQAQAITFQDLNLLDQACTHSSYLNEAPAGTPDNQRLEYLGDSVLGLVINEYLYREYGTFSEGRLARIKSAVVAEAPLAAIAAEIGVGDLLLLSRGEQNSGGRTRPSNLADALEAIIAALYLDAGLETCRGFVLRVFARILTTHTDPVAVRDPKSLLQEWVQKKFNRLPEYVTVSESGPQHRPVFEIQVLIESQLAGTGSGSSRKKAEQMAAQAALQWLDEQEAKSKKNPTKRRSDRAAKSQEYN